MCWVRQRRLLGAGAQGSLPRAALLEGARKLRHRHKLVRPGIIRPVLLQRCHRDGTRWQMLIVANAWVLLDHYHEHVRRVHPLPG